MSDVLARIQDYLTDGGLFNPELANHGAVSDLIIDCRSRIMALEAAEAYAVLEAPVEAGDWSLGDRVEKKYGSNWRGKIVGFYSTKLTPVGYAVESENEPGSVQIYPKEALAALPSAPVGECEACGGCGYEVVSVAECCNRPTRSGECCCNPVEGQKQEPCSACGGSGKIPAPVPGFVMVPREPTNEMWGNDLVRWIVRWMGYERPTPKSLLFDLKVGYGEPPKWLLEEPEIKSYPDHVVTKGTRATILYRAMIAALEAK